MSDILKQLNTSFCVMALMYQNSTDKTCCANLNTIDNGCIEAMGWHTKERKTETEQKILLSYYII